MNGMPEPDWQAITNEAIERRRNRLIDLRDKYERDKLEIEYAYNDEWKAIQAQKDVWRTKGNKEHSCLSS